MQLVILILLIPLCSVSFFIYLNTLLNYALNDTLNIPLFTGSLSAFLLLGFFCIYIFGNIRVLSANKLNFESKVIPYFGYSSFIILFLFGIANMVNAFKGDMSPYKILGSGLIFILFIYITFFYIFRFKTGIFKLGAIESYDDVEDLDEKEEKKDPDLPKMKKKTTDILCLIFENDDIDYIDYYTEDKTYEKDKYYKIRYNPKLKLVSKIYGEVKVIK